jgi:uncharacterized protein (DUF885 family)
MCADVRSRVADLADRYWQAFVEAHPVAATSFGDRRNDDRMDDLSHAATVRFRARLAALLDETRPLAEALAADARTAEALAPDAGARPAEAHDAEALAPDGARRSDGARPSDDAVTASALASQLGHDIADIDADILPWTVDPLEGPQVSIFNIESFQRIDTPAEGRAMVARWHAMGPFVDQHAANLREALAGGRVAVRTPVAHVIEALDTLLAQSDETWPLLAPAREAHPSWSPADLGIFRADLAAAVADDVRPALLRLREVLAHEILLATRSDDMPGLMHVRGGAEAYPLLIRTHTSLDLTPDALHAIGLSEVARINSELEVLGDRVLGTADRTAILHRLRTDSALYFATSDEVADKAASALARAREAIPGWFGTLPRAECVVVRMGEHEAKHGTIAYYRQPAPDGSRPGRYYVNATEPTTRPRYEAEALAYHESIPGHHLQIALAQEVAGLPEFRRHLGVTAFWEGWGLYSERLSNEMGLYSGDLDRIGMLSLDAWRACRLVVDTGMHAMGWTRRHAIDYMTANSALAPNNIANEVDRYIVWPGQALAYKVGQLEMLRLREEARQRQGAAFDIRAFHDALLSGGALGLRTVREIVERRTGPAAR